MNDDRIKSLSWFIEIVILLCVTGLFWNINTYLAICIFAFHGLATLQIFNTQNLIGSQKTIIKTSQKIQSALLVFTLLGCVGLQIWKRSITVDETFMSVTTEQIIELSNGEFFPYITMICLLSALLMFGLIAERRRR